MTNYRSGDLLDGRYLIQEHLGTGGFSDVFKAEDELTHTTVAIKIYNSLDKHGIEIFRKEYQKVNDLNHQRLLKAQHFNVVDGSPYLILPYCANGSLTRLLVNEDHLLSEHQIADILLQVSEGLEYLHRNNVVHQDIKPDNILELKPGQYVLSDFGISQRIRSTMAKSTRRTQKMDDISSGYTLQYAPPEAERLSRRSLPSKDIFSLGVTLYELAAKDIPFNDTGKAIEKNMALPPLPSLYSKGLMDLVRNCLHLNPEARPTATELKQMAQQYLAQGVWTFPKREKAFSPPAQSTPSRKQKSATPPTPAEEAKSTGSKTAKSKRGWLLALLAIPVVAGLSWGVYQKIGPGGASPQGPETVTDTVSTTTPIEEDPIATAPSDTPATLANPPAEETVAEPNQQQYDDIIASAERNYRRGNYEISLGKFESAKGLVSDDQAAIDGIAKCEQKIADLDEERQRQATAAEEAAERQRQAEAANQKRYGDLIASAERDYSRGNYQSSLDKFESARGIVSNDQAAIDGIVKSERKLEEERQRQAAEQEAERKRRAAASYRTIRLNGQTWLAQNLNYDTGSGSWCYDNDPANCRKYGRLYTWAAAKKACAALGSGWRLPTDREWGEIRQQFGGDQAAYKALIDGGSSGFKALLGGNRYSDGSFIYLGTYGSYWSGTEKDTQSAWSYNFFRNGGLLRRGGHLKSYGRSCRCVKD